MTREFDFIILQFKNIYMYMYQFNILKVQSHAWFHNAKVKYLNTIKKLMWLKRAKCVSSNQNCVISHAISLNKMNK